MGAVVQSFFVLSTTKTQMAKEANANKLITVSDLEKFKSDLLTEIGRMVKVTGGQSIKKWLKTTEVLKLLGVSAGKLQTMRKSGTIPYTRIGGSLYYDPEQINKMFENGIVRDQ